MGYIQMNARKLTSFSDRIQADLIKSLLESNEIPVMIQHDSAIGYPGNAFSADGFHLYVPEDLYEEAMKIISANGDL
jgi:hypothetical protein